MAKLIDDCAEFVAWNLNDMVNVPLDMNNISQNALKKIASLVSLAELDNFRDPRDCLQSKLFMNKFQDLISSEDSQFHLCMFCHQLFTNQ